MDQLSETYLYDTISEYYAGEAQGYGSSELEYDTKPEENTSAPATYTNFKKFVEKYKETGDLDPNLCKNDLIAVIDAEIDRKKIAGHHLNSMNDFYRVGLKQIATKLFTAEINQMQNRRDKTEEDKTIEYISCKVEFTDVALSPPITTKYLSGNQTVLTPNMARLKNHTYSAPFHIAAKITATAQLKTGELKVRTDEITLDNKLSRIASIPVMVRSDLCNTNNSSEETLKELEEDPKDPGGYFIIKGGEWTIDSLENLLPNAFHVYKNMHDKEIARGTFQSKPGDYFENSYYLILRYLTTGAITIEITTNKFSKFEIPFYIIFRIFGMTRDKDIFNHIVYGLDNQDDVTKHMIDVLENAYNVPDPKFNDIKDAVDSESILMFMVEKLNPNIKPIDYKKSPDTVKYLINNMLSTFDKFLFPHIGNTPGDRPNKLYFLGHLIHKLLRVEMEVLEGTDRDSYKNKRVHSAGVSFAKTFKTQFNFVIVQELRKHFMNDFTSTSFSDVNLTASFKAAINNPDLERVLVQGIVSGNKTITVKRNEVNNRLSSQQLYHKNDLNVISTLNAINATNSTSAKQNERADEMRRVHATYVGYICLSQSADTGEKVGMSKQMACTASITSASSSYALKDILRNDPDIIHIDKIIDPAEITLKKLVKVFVNGDWIGFCKKSHELVYKYRMLRRFSEEEGGIDPFTTIVREPLIREVYFWVDVGRLTRPLLIVYNNIAEYSAAIRQGKPAKFKQWIKLTKRHIIGLQGKKITIDDLRKQRIIEYITPDEQENTNIAMSFDVLVADRHDVTKQYTHCDIEQAIFGFVALTAPFANHTNSSRITYQTNQRKQTCGWFSLNWPYRIDKNTFLQYYCEMPLAKTFTDKFTYPSGQNAIVALMIHSGFNQEDSVVVNKSAVDRGLFVGSRFYYEKTELEKGEQFGNPDFARTLDKKRNANYEFIENGFVKEGILVTRNTVLIVKTATIPKPTDKYLYIDKSIVYKFDEPAIVEKVIVSRNDEDILMAKVKLRSYRPLKIGDKISSRSGNKSICAALWDQSDMPYTESGIVPDIILNPHCVPTRMNVGQIIEGIVTQLAVERGCIFDATAFRANNVDDIIKELESYGIKNKGKHRMFNGRTGNWIDTLIFVSPIGYQRLQKFVTDDSYSVASGPTCALTRQPLDGKSNGGGLKLGEMEKDVVCSHGAMSHLHEKFFDDSDGFKIPICRLCGTTAIVNIKANIYRCKICGDSSDIAFVDSSWTANLFFHQTDSMNIKQTFELTPFTYSRPE